jgi:hypothetical protein
MTATMPRRSCSCRRRERRRGSSSRRRVSEVEGHKVVGRRKEKECGRSMSQAGSKCM